MSATDTAARLLRSTGAATASQVWRFGVTFGTHMLLRRLLLPEAWGLWHWAADFLFLLLAQVRDLGLPAHVVRDRRRPYGNFLALEVGWGVALAAAVALGAPWLARLYGAADPEVTMVLRALALFLVFEGLGRVALTFFEAELLIDRALVPELVRNLVFAATALALGTLDMGVWSLVWGHVAAAGTFAAMLWWRARGRMVLTWLAGGTWELVRSSLPLMVMAFLLLTVEWVDLQIVAWRFPGDVVGRYGGALYLALLVPRLLELPIRRALYPAFVAVAGERERFFETYRLATVLLLALEVPFAYFLFANAETLLVLLWGADYAEAAPLLRILAFAPIVQPWSRCAEDVILTRHQERLLIVASLLTLATLAGLGLFLTARLGPEGMAWAKLVPLGALPIAWAMYRVHPRGFRRLGGDLLVLYLLPLPLFAVAMLATADGHPYLRLAATLATGAVAFGAYAAIYQRAFRRFFGRG